MNRNMDCLMVALLQACHLANYPATGGGVCGSSFATCRPLTSLGKLEYFRACRVKPSCKLLVFCSALAGTHLAVK